MPDASPVDLRFTYGTLSCSKKKQVSPLSHTSGSIAMHVGRQPKLRSLRNVKSSTEMLPPSSPSSLPPSTTEWFPEDDSGPMDADADEEEEAEVERTSGSSGEHECERVRVSGQWQRAQAPSTVDERARGGVAMRRGRPLGTLGVLDPEDHEKIGKEWRRWQEGWWRQEQQRNGLIGTGRHKLGQRRSVIW